MHLTTRQLTRGALLVTLALVLGLTGLGEIPVPTPARAITWTHVPVILAGIVLGPFLGGMVGMIWGIHQAFHWGAIWPDPIVHIVPRVAVGVFSAWTWRLMDRLLAGHPSRLTVSAAAAALVGTITNTIGVLGLATARNWIPAPAAETVAVLHLPLELAVAVLITVPTVVALHQTLYQKH